MVTRGSKSLSEDEQARVRAQLKELTQRRGEQASLAKRLGVTPQAISKIVLEESDPGVRIARALADHLGVTLDALLGKEEAAEDAEPKMCNLPGWAVAEAAARRRFRYVPEEAWQAVRNLRTATPPRHLSADWIGAIASDWARALSGESAETEK